MTGLSRLNDCSCKDNIATVAKWMAFPQDCFTSLGGKGNFTIFIVTECLPLTMLFDIVLSV